MQKKTFVAAVVAAFVSSAGLEARAQVSSALVQWAKASSANIQTVLSAVNDESLAMNTTQAVDCVLDAKLKQVPARTPSGTISVAEVTANVCKQAYPSVSPIFSKFATDSVAIDFDVERGCLDGHAVTFMVPLDPSEFVKLGLNPKTVKIFLRAYGQHG